MGERGLPVTVVFGYPFRSLRALRRVLRDRPDELKDFVHLLWHISEVGQPGTQLRVHGRLEADSGDLQVM
jgi:hypothetical protein